MRSSFSWRYSFFENAANDLQHLHEGEVAGWNHRAQKHSGRRIGRRRGHFKEVKEKVERDDVEDEAEQHSGDVGYWFHGQSLIGELPPPHLHHKTGGGAG